MSLGMEVSWHSSSLHHPAVQKLRRVLKRAVLSGLYIFITDCWHISVEMWRQPQWKWESGYFNSTKWQLVFTLQPRAPGVSGLKHQTSAHCCYHRKQGIGEKKLLITDNAGRSRSGHEFRAAQPGGFYQQCLLQVIPHKTTACFQARHPALNNLSGSGFLSPTGWRNKAISR